MYKDRIALYKELEQRRDSKVIAYVTGDRRGAETQIHSEVLNFFVDHLDLIGNVPKISLYLYTCGGQTLAAWSIANLLRQFASEFEVIVPSKALSAGTLICLGANKIVMTKQATLGPIDPSVNNPLSPAVPGAPPSVRVPVSVEAINGFIELAKEMGIETSCDMGTVLSSLSTHVHPLVLGEVYRTRSQIKMLGSRLLSTHIDDGGKINNIVSFLCSESGSHDYTIYRQEARDVLGLCVETPDDDLYSLIKRLYEDMSAELELTNPFNPQSALNASGTLKYVLKRSFVESANGGSHIFVTEGSLAKQRVTDTITKITQESVVNNLAFEGWRYERV